MTTTVIYLWGIADDFNTAVIGISVAAFVLAAAALLFSVACKAESDEEGAAVAMLAFKKAFVMGFATLTVSVLVPSSKTIAAMVVIPAIAQSDAIKRDLPEIYSAAVSKLKEELGIKEAEQPK